ncbi:rod shape-determining protein MreD [Algibacter amylolyticus]|uniref:Rod shape-determining protein MreD n=1 Tax=Algibacter amylolyticus TaxID=1608400 RepID=A0A5M7B9P5_9FLAO|nr:rod shape-determining protein MreD [Algibacter amylolyticus]KAA5826296.1 rod shape-determining protein MreD [Algibacter amylolyticus]MBB5268499.1 rod shape-determining protein MreD [Algibacter amylolyticus]TSJ80334.1 rod shape-determining protein MreD [Algibacter amylolyticus]
MNSIFSIHTVRFLVLVFVQVLILNHINFLGYINPYIYILFIALFPVKNNRVVLILLSFLLGLTVDMFLDTGGIHAGACVFIAYARPVILKSSFGMIYEHQSIKFNTVEFGSKLTYFTLLTVLHHIVLFSLEIFSVSRILLILQKTLFSSIFTILLSVIVTIIFSRKTK